ncbi:MAG: thioredoxin fold domain-containing protein [Deltaproteobacteria bacterium]|nr:thioredoxin fold domain-containing protein [Deltaproteobacteria bacterium]
MIKSKIILWGLLYVVLSCFQISQTQAEPPKGRIVGHEYPGLANHVLESAKMVRMEEGLIVKSEGMEIRESHLKKMVNKADPGVRQQLEKNLFFLLEQETMKRVLVREAQRAGISMTSPAEETQAIQVYLNLEVQDVSVSDEEVKDFYDENKEMVGGLPFDQVKEPIRQVLFQRKRAGAVNAHIQDVVRKADIRIDEKWVKTHHALAMDNPVDRARMSGKPTMVEFGATGCIPCDMMQPILDELRKNYADKLNVVFVHVRENRILGSRFGIQSIPVQVFYNEKGKEVFRHVGFFPEKEVLKQVAKLGVE